MTAARMRRKSNFNQYGSDPSGYVGATRWTCPSPASVRRQSRRAPPPAGFSFKSLRPVLLPAKQPTRNNADVARAWCDTRRPAVFGRRERAKLATLAGRRRCITTRARGCLNLGKTRADRPALVASPPTTKFAADYDRCFPPAKRLMALQRGSKILRRIAGAEDYERCAIGSRKRC